MGRTKCNAAIRARMIAISKYALDESDNRTVEQYCTDAGYSVASFYVYTSNPEYLEILKEQGSIIIKTMMPDICKSVKVLLKKGEPSIVKYLIDKLGVLDTIGASNDEILDNVIDGQIDNDLLMEDEEQGEIVNESEDDVINGHIEPNGEV